MRLIEDARLILLQVTLGPVDASVSAVHPISLSKADPGFILRGVLLLE